MFHAKEEGKLELLSEDVWGRLENTESHEFDKDEWRIVKEVSEAQERVRDWQKFKTLEEKGVPIDAPIILKCGDTYHLVSGNTRLMVAHALGITPKVLLFEYRHDRSDE